MGPGKISAIEYRFEEVSALKMRTRQIRPAQVRSPKISAPKIGPGKVESTLVAPS